MEDKITRELQIEMRRSAGPFRISIRPKSSDTLDQLVNVTRYEGMSLDRVRIIEEETQRLFVPVCTLLENYGLILGKTYVADSVLRNVSALLTKDQIVDLARQEYVLQISTNFQKGLPF